MGDDGRPTPETQTPFQSEGEANTSPGRRRWVEANHDATTSTAPSTSWMPASGRSEMTSNR